MKTATTATATNYEQETFVELMSIPLAFQNGSNKLLLLSLTDDVGVVAAVWPLL